MLKNLEKFYPYIQTFFLMAGIGILASSYCADFYPGFAALPAVSIVGMLILCLGLVFVFRKWRLWSFVSVSGLVLAFFLLFSGWKKIEHLAGWILGVPAEEPYPELLYTVLIVFAVLLGLALLLVFLLGLPFVPSVFGVLVFAVLMYWDIRGEELEKSGVAFLLVYVAAAVSELVQRRQEKRPEQEGKKVLVSLAPFFLGFFAILMVSATRTEAYRWGFFTGFVDGVKELAKKVELRLEYYMEGESFFSIAFAGAEGNGTLGYAVVDRERDQLTVNLRSTAKTSFYITGSVWDRFDGKKWEMSETDTGAGGYTEQDLDYMEMMYALYCLDPKRTSDYVKEVSGSLNYEDIFTKTVFYLPKFSKMTTPGTSYSWDGSVAAFGRPRGEGTQVAFSYLQLNLGSEKFDRLIEEAQQLSYEETNADAIRELKKGYGWRTPDNLAELLAEREEKIREMYGQAPELSPEVKALADRVTEAGTDGYEKLKLLEAYLNTYTYTTAPVQIGEDFLTDFLCETKEGYCTYFATAFVELARYLGYPARYVQGFVVQPEGSSTKNILVQSGDSHAWAEVYIHGIGWIPFEATPGYGEIRYTPWSVKAPSHAGDVPVEDDYPFQEDPMEEELPELIPEEPDEKKPILPVILRGMGVFAGILAALWVVFHVLARRIHRRTEEEQYYLYWKRIFYLFAVMGMKREDSDTMEDFRMRLRNLGEFDRILPDDRFETFSAVRYGGEELKKRELKELKEAADRLYKEYEKTHAKGRSYLVKWTMILRISG